jgi:probable phosphoglycerate mutase
MTSAPMIFIRHGETDWNREARLQGQQDIALNALGRRQAARNGRILPLLLGGTQWRFIASPLARATDTMTIALKAAGMAGQAFETDDRLKEISFGRWEGLTLAEVAQKDADGERNRQADKWRYVPPDGESYADLCERIGGWLADQDRPAVVVAHGGILRVLQHRLGGVAAADAPLLVVPQDRITVFARRRVIAI